MGAGFVVIGSYPSVATALAGSALVGAATGIVMANGNAHLIEIAPVAEAAAGGAPLFWGGDARGGSGSLADSAGYPRRSAFVKPLPNFTCVSVCTSCGASG